MKNTSRARTLGAVAAAAAGLMLTASVAAPAFAEDHDHGHGERIVLSQGHADAFNFGYADDELTMNLVEDITGSHVAQDPHDVLLHVKPEAQLTAPGTGAFTFLGATGAPVWILPQTQNPNLLWPGWNTEALAPGTFVGNTVDLTVTDVEGPGAFQLYQVDAFSQPTVLVNSNDGLPDTITSPVGSHTHANWAFSAEGLYEITVEGTAVRASDSAALTTGPVEYELCVGPLEGCEHEQVVPELSIAGVETSYEVGDTVNLTAQQTPETDLDHYHWFTKAAGAENYAIVPANGTGAYSFTATEALDGTQVVAKLYGEGHAVLVESAPVTINVNEAQEPVIPALSIAGAASSYDVGDMVNLAAQQTPETDLDHYHWFTKAAGAENYAIVPANGTGAYSFTATEALDGTQVVVKLYGAGHAVVAESAPVTINVNEDETPAPGGEFSQTITATLDENAGALVASVDAADREVTMTDFELNTDADRWSSNGELRPVTVTDTRAGAPGWNVSGQVSDFTSGGDSFDGKHLGWAPNVLSAPNGTTVSAGPAVATGFESGTGVKTSRVLGSAATGNGFGTSELGAGLTLEVPTTLVPGTYQGLLTLTVI